MKIKPLTSEDIGHELICESFLVSDISDFQQLINLFHEYEAKFKECSIMLTLDDLGQAQYTSMHAKMTHDLDDTEGYDLSALDTKAFENGEHIGYLSTKSEFFIRRNNFLIRAKGTNFADACERGLTLQDEELTLLEHIHENPLSFIDKKVVLTVVPVEQSYLTISAFPNGYFSSDLNPFENYSVAKLLAENYGYKLFGIGASLLGFIRHQTLNQKEASLLAADLRNLYNEDKCESKIDRLVNLAKNYNFFFLKYVDYLEG